jgi:large subunit ribosomal protein L13
MKTFSPRPQDIERRWYVVDADGVVLGRLASEVAAVLRGKHKPIFAPHADTGDHVIVINARGVRLTGAKQESKVAYRHSGYPGGLSEVGYGRLMTQRPAFVVEKAVRGMLPKNRLGRAMARKLMVYPGPEHPHAAQKPEPLALGSIPAWNGLPVPPEPKARPEREPAAAKARPKARGGSSRPSATTGGARAGGTRTRAGSRSAGRSTAKSTAKKPTAKSAGKSTAKSTRTRGASPRAAAKKSSAAGSGTTKTTRRSRGKQESE